MAPNMTLAPTSDQIFALNMTLNLSRVTNVRFLYGIALWLCAALATAPRVLPAVEAAAAVDRDAILRASAFYNAGRFVEAEPVFRKAIAAMDAGAQSKNDLGRCVGPLVVIYRAWGRLDDALGMAERQRAFLEAAPIDAGVRAQLLEENAIQRIDILAALNRFENAERLLQPMLDKGQAAGADPVHRLTLWTKAARLADMAADAAKAHERWLKVAELGNDLLTQIERRKLAAAKLPEVAADVVAADVAVENFAAAIKVDRRLLAAQSAARDRAAALRTAIEIAALEAQNGDYAGARSGLEELLGQVHKASPGALDEADLLGRLATVLEAQGLATQAKQRWREAAAIAAAALAQADRESALAPEVMNLLTQLQITYQHAGQFRHAIDAARRLLTLREQRLGKLHPLTVAVRSDLGALYGADEDYESAKPLLVESLDFWRRRDPPAPIQLARVLNDLGVVERAIGSFAEAQTHFDEALAIRQRLLRSDDLRLAYSLNNAASVRLAKGDYAAAIALFDRAIAIYRQRGRIADDSLSNALLNVAMAYKSQGQFKRAGEYCRDALRTYVNVFGPDAPGAVAYYSALTALAIADDRIDAADEENRHAWDICRQQHLDHDPIAATVLHHRATIAYRRGDFDAARRDWNAALEIQSTAGQAAQAARTLNYLARVESRRGHADAAETLYRQALEQQQTIQAYPAVRYLTLCNLAEILHSQGKLDEATELLRQAVKLVEAPRAGTIGAEEQRAEYFAQFASAFDLLVAWDLQAGQIDRAFETAERGRSRTFLDQLSLAGIDLRETLTGDEGQKIQERERAARERLGTLRGQLQAAASAGQPASDIARLAKQLAAAEDQFAQAWTDIRNASPYYREQLAHGARIGSLATVRQTLARRGGLLLFYYLGAKQSFLLVIGDERTPVEVVALEIPQPLADGLHVAAGPLTRAAMVPLVSQYLADLRDRAGGRGLSGIVHSPKGIIASEQGTQLAEVVLPRAVRKRIQERNPRQVVIVPDGALHEIPFESLLVEGGATPRYLLDVLPPIAYAPSATILMNLEARPAAAVNRPATVLTVGNPHYPAAVERPNPSAVAALSRAAYLELGGVLPPLPGTSRECARVAAAFPSANVTHLEFDEATESNVRGRIGGRRYVHLAAHGLVDQQHGNLFGAIALTPGPTAAVSSDDDGFLSLHEIHALPLKDCELVALSACQTNVGPDRPLEAGASLAQAFLAAGSRRVICSHWNVDDASTAELMGAFFEGVAKAEKGGEPLNYARLLQDARKTVRANPRWSSPYYWAPFVLVGPAD